MSFGQRASPPQISLTTAEPRRRARRLLTPYLMALVGVVVGCAVAMALAILLSIMLGRATGDLSPIPALMPAVVVSALVICLPVFVLVDIGLSRARIHSVQAYAMASALLSVAVGLGLIVLLVVLQHESQKFLMTSLVCALAGGAGGAALGYGRKPRR